MSNKEQFFNNALNGLATNSIKSIALKQDDLSLISHLVSVREDKSNFSIIDNFGRFVLKYIKKEVTYLV